MASAYKLVGYFTNWSQYRPDPAKFLPENIDPQLFTHLVYAFATMVDHKIAHSQWNDDVLYKQFNNLKKQNPKLLTLLAIGGWTFGTAKFTEMVASPDTRKIFIDSVIEYLRKYNFDGIDLDFEYPGARGSPPEDKQRFTSLTQVGSRFCTSPLLSVSYTATSILNQHPASILASDNVCTLCMCSQHLG
ncbi:hypothetical protein FKM82_022349 [Ascaphus truei]